MMWVGYMGHMVAEYRSGAKGQLFIHTPPQVWLLDTIGELVLGFDK